jgi:hypothetical protein
VRICDIEFREPILAGVNNDALLAVMELIVGEAASPFSWDEPNFYRVAYHGVVEVRSHRDPVGPFRDSTWSGKTSFQFEGILRYGERDASDEVVERDDKQYGLLPPFRNPVGLRGPWGVRGEELPRLAWLSTWGMYIEFLFCRGVESSPLAARDASRLWREQWRRHCRSPRKSLRTAI